MGLSSKELTLLAPAQAGPSGPAFSPAGRSLQGPRQTRPRSVLGTPLAASLLLHAAMAIALAWALAEAHPERRRTAQTSGRPLPAMTASLMAPADGLQAVPNAPPAVQPPRVEATDQTPPVQGTVRAAATDAAESARMSATAAPMDMPAAAGPVFTAADTPDPPTMAPAPAFPPGPALPTLGGRRRFVPAWVQGPPPDLAWQQAEIAARQRDLLRLQFDEGLAQLQARLQREMPPAGAKFDCRFDAAWSCREGTAVYLQPLAEMAVLLRQLRPELAPTVRTEGQRLVVGAEPLATGP